VKNNLDIFREKRGTRFISSFSSKSVNLDLKQIPSLFASFVSIVIPAGMHKQNVGSHTFCSKIFVRKFLFELLPPDINVVVKCFLHEVHTLSGLSSDDFD
jgi:hypothetical protein